MNVNEQSLLSEISTYYTVCNRTIPDINFVKKICYSIVELFKYIEPIRYKITVTPAKDLLKIETVSLVYDICQRHYVRSDDHSRGFAFLYERGDGVEIEYEYANKKDLSEAVKTTFNIKLNQPGWDKPLMYDSYVRPYSTEKIVDDFAAIAKHEITGAKLKRRIDKSNIRRKKCIVRITGNKIRISNNPVMLNIMYAPSNIEFDPYTEEPIEDSYVNCYFTFYL